MLGKDPFPFDLLYWNADSTAMPARAHRFYLEEFYIRNAFAKGELKVDGAPITLGDIKGPVFHVATKEDHIAPAASVYRGAKEMKRREGAVRLSGSGHIAGVVNPPVLGKYQFWTNPDMSAADARGVAEGRRRDAGQLVAELGRLAEAAVGPDGAGARAGRETRSDRGRARVLRPGPFRRAGGRRVGREAGGLEGTSRQSRDVHSGVRVAMSSPPDDSVRSESLQSPVSRPNLAAATALERQALRLRRVEPGGDGEMRRR